MKKTLPVFLLFFSLGANAQTLSDGTVIGFSKSPLVFTSVQDSSLTALINRLNAKENTNSTETGTLYIPRGSNFGTATGPNENAGGSFLTPTVDPNELPYILTDQKNSTAALGITEKELNEIIRRANGQFSGSTISNVTATGNLSQFIIPTQNTDNTLNGSFIKLSDYVVSKDKVSLTNPVYTFSDQLNKPGAAVNQNLEQQNDVNSATFYRSDYTQWAKMNGTAGTMTSVTLYSTSSRSGVPFGAGIFLEEDKNNKLGFYADSIGAHLGWVNSNKGDLTINAGTILTNAAIVQNGPFTNTRGIIVSGAATGNLTMPDNIQAYFAANTNAASGVLIENQNAGRNALSGIQFREQGTTSFIGITGSAGLSGMLDARTFTIQSNAENGLLLSAMDNEKIELSTIRFAVNNHEAARFDAFGDLLIGTQSTDQSAIVNIFSESKGVLLPRLSSNVRQAMLHPTEGVMLYDKKIHKLFVYTGSYWEVVTSMRID